MADTFLRLPGWKVRGITRNPSSSAAQALAASGVELVKGDFDDKQSLFLAFEGATVIFSNTDFFCHLQEALVLKEISNDRTPNRYAFDREVEQGINIAEAAASPATLKTLERFVFSSLSAARELSRGKYTGIYHNDSKAEIIRATQTRFPELAARMSTVQIGHYVRSWQAFPPLMPQKQPDGSFLVQRSVGPECKMAFVVAHKDTGAFVKALVDLPPQKNLEGVSEHKTWPEWTKLWGDIVGVKATFEQVSEDYAFRGAPDPFRQEIAEAFRYTEEFGYTGGDPEVLTAEQVSLVPLHIAFADDFQLGIKIPVTSLEEYIKSEDWSSVL